MVDTWRRINGRLVYDSDLQSLLDSGSSIVVTTDIVAESSNKRYVTDAQLALLNNTKTFVDNLGNYNASYSYSGGKLTSIVYAKPGGSVTKTLNYSGDTLTSIVLSGSVPSGILTTKTFGYTGASLTSIAYS